MSIKGSMLLLLTEINIPKNILTYKLTQFERMLLFFMVQAI